MAVGMMECDGGGVEIQSLKENFVCAPCWKKIISVNGGETGKSKT